MRFNKLNNWLGWGIIGGFLGGLIAIIGFWVFTVLESPPSDNNLASLILFIIPRIIIGSIVASIMGPRFVKNKSKSNQL